MLDVTAWYSHLKTAHISLVVMSGVLFASRGSLVLAGRGWVMARPWRLLSYGIDSLLLAAGVTLWAVLSLNPVASPWLGVKLILLVLYIVLGSLALKRAPTPALQRASYAGALGVYLFMVSVALAHHPLGFFRPEVAHAG
jgi:uncharacterized membrane protein SirB2